MTERLARLLMKAVAFALGAGALWLAWRFVLPWTAPFLAAWIFAALLEPAVRFLVRHRWRRGAASGLCTLAALGLLGWALTALIGRGMAALSALTGTLPALMEALSRRLLSLEALIDARLQAVPEPVNWQRKC